jgi:hypothetical protein
MVADRVSEILRPSPGVVQDQLIEIPSPAAEQSYDIKRPIVPSARESPILDSEITPYEERPFISGFARDFNGVAKDFHEVANQFGRRLGISDEFLSEYFNYWSPPYGPGKQPCFGINLSNVVSPLWHSMTLLAECVSLKAFSEIL